MRLATSLRAPLRDHVSSLGCAAVLTALVTGLSAALGWPQAVVAAASAAAIFFWLCPPRLLALALGAGGAS